MLRGDGMVRELARCARRFEARVTGRPDRIGPAGEPVGGRGVADGTVQALLVVLRDEGGDLAPRIVERRRDLRANGGDFERLIPAFQLAVRLRIVGRRAHVGHAGHPDEVAKVALYTLRPVVGNHARARVGKPFARALQDCGDVLGGHRRAEFPVHEIPQPAVENGGQIVKRAGDIDVREIDVPVLVRLCRLVEARAFFR